MYAPASSALLPARVLFLARSGPGVRTDVRLLRSMGVQSVTQAAKGRDVIARLEKDPRFAQPAQDKTGIDALVCDEELEDMSAAAFLLALAEHPALSKVPVIVLASSPEISRALRADGVQCLARPYALNDLTRAFTKALSPMRAPLRAESLRSLVDREAPVARGKTRTPAEEPVTTSELFSHAMNHLTDENSSRAETGLLEVLRRQEDHVEACIAMARIHRSRGNAAQMQCYLLRAAAASLRQGDRKRAAAISALLPERMRGGSVFVYEAMAHMEEGVYRSAALSFLDACREFPDVHLHALVARACQFTAKPEECLSKLCNAYESMGHAATAKKLRQRLLSSAEFEYVDGPSWLDKFPVLKEAVSVASFTAWVWKQA